jgi:hypothetical protein
MRSFLQSLVAVLTLGMFSMGCGKQQPQEPAAPSSTDVTLLVPGMN